MQVFFLQIDVIVHRLITSLYQGNKSKLTDSKMADVNIACRQLAAKHPVLVLRYVHCDKTGFKFETYHDKNFFVYKYCLVL